MTGGREAGGNGEAGETTRGAARERRDGGRGEGVVEREEGRGGRGGGMTNRREFGEIDSIQGRV